MIHYRSLGLLSKLVRLFSYVSLVSQSKEARHIDLKTVYGKIGEVYGNKMSIDIKNVFNGVMVS